MVYVMKKKSEDSITSSEVRACISRILGSEAITTLFAQHTLWQAMDDPSKMMSPEAFYRAMQKGHWVRKERKEVIYRGGPLGQRGTKGIQRIYVNKELEGLQPKFFLNVFMDEADEKVYEVDVEFYCYNASKPTFKKIPARDAFPDRAYYPEIT